jgi:hypothetical protein
MIGNRVWLHVRYRSWSVAVAMLCLLVAGLTRDAQATDAPTRAARLSFLQGSVTVEQTDNTGSDPAQLNMPLAQGVRVATGGDGQAEIEFEDGSIVRLTPNSSLDLTSLSADGDGNFQTNLTLGYGLVYGELRAAEKFAYKLNAGGEVISPIENATVRVAMDKPPAAISVLDGTVQVERSGSADGESYRTNVHSGETLTGDASDPGRYTVTQEIAANSWDKWNDDRDKAAAEEAANQTTVREDYAGEAGYGWSDLDANGSWYSVPGEGEVWQPNVALDAGFDPYGYGSWVWYPGSGYVWASGYGWGWTPYRCGNWSYWTGFGWGWLPGNGCGFGAGFGRGYGGGGYSINIVRPPRGYRFQPIPVHSPGHIHPIRVGRPIANPIQTRPVRGPRTIAGHTVEPVRPVRADGPMKGARAGGASLQRDFPVDRSSHRPVLGRVGGGRESANPATGVRREVERPGLDRPGVEGSGTVQRQGERPVVVQPGVVQPGVQRPTGERRGPGADRPGVDRPLNPRTGSEGREAPVRPMRPEPPQVEQQREIRQRQEQVRPVRPETMPQSRPQPEPRYQAPVEPRSAAPAQPRYTPPAQPRYSPPAQPNYSPPAQPRYSPPPSQPHYAPPPSAPAAPRPAPSATTPAPSSRK